MRTSDLRYPSSNENSNVRFSSHFQFLPQQHNQTQNIYYQTPVAIPISPQIANGSHLNNYSLYPQIYQIPNHQQIMMSGNQPLLISMPNTNNSISDNTSLGNISTIDSSISSSVTSPISMTAQNQFSINYTVSKWHEISLYYDGNIDERPSAGQLKNGKYFTQRSAGKDIYMVFNSISDYINNFVNYYFSNKNFSTDEKLFNLMDESGCVALKDLIKFPRLAHIGTTVDDIIEALKYNNFVKIVNLKNDIKGVRRTDGWFPNKLIDDSHQSNVSQWVPITGGDSVAPIYPKKSEINDIHGKNKLLFIPPSSSGMSGSNQNNNGLESNVVISQSSHHSDIVNPLIDNGVGSNSLIYFNPPNNTIHQPIYPSAFMHGIHQIQSQTTGGHLLTPANPTPLILHAQHYPTFYQHNQSFHLRPFWPNQNIADLGGNPILYTSNNNANVRHVIGAGGGNNVNTNLR